MAISRPNVAQCGRISSVASALRNWGPNRSVDWAAERPIGNGGDVGCRVSSDIALDSRPAFFGCDSYTWEKCRGRGITGFVQTFALGRALSHSTSLDLAEVRCLERACIVGLLSSRGVGFLFQRCPVVLLPGVGKPNDKSEADHMRTTANSANPHIPLAGLGSSHVNGTIRLGLGKPQDGGMPISPGTGPPLNSTYVSQPTEWSKAEW
ncbi:hypothetical protein B0I37DRAFT_18382 [Chaetomium sp. MPI-CAGE-AT-0009]|nr:hypothetical protein B0I37DRAFT_18382 [Chaetomium sp. MPI-CAGE-AT-0009]